MSENITTKRKIRVKPVVAASSKFSRYKPEEEKEVRKVSVAKDQVLEQLIAAWKKTDYDDTDRPYDVYKKASKQIKRISYSAKDVEKFSVALVEFQDEERFYEKAGLFLSALINKGKDTEYVIHTQHLSQEVHNLGYLNTKNLVVNGDAGPEAGAHMKKGNLTVNGNAGDWMGEVMKGGTITVNGNAGKGVGKFMRGGSITVNGNANIEVGGWMKDGTITVNGNAGDDVGCAMEDGIITVKGDAGKLVGDGMRGGAIHVEGHYEKLGGGIKGGKIYHKGVLIVGK